MNQLAALLLPALIAVADERAQLRFLEFFTATIHDKNTRRAYAQPCARLLA
ncbi:MAG: integrase [Bradyrhizobium sp.]|nr:integrase [Bradyrhizobium sp.]